MTYQEAQDRWDRLTKTINKFDQLRKIYDAEVPKELTFQYNNCNYMALPDMPVQPLIHSQLCMYANRIHATCDLLGIKEPSQIQKWIEEEIDE